jgi:hypothetical protein
VRGRSSRRWSCRSSRTSSPWRRGTAGTPLGLVRRRSPTPRTRARWRVAARWQNRGTTRHRRSTGIPDRRNMADWVSPARRRVDVGGGDVCRRGAAQAEGEPRSRNRALPRQSGCRLAGECIVLRGDARSPSVLRSRLSRVLTGASTALRR